MTRDEASRDLRAWSWIAFGVERFFRFLEKLSPASHLRHPRHTDFYIGGVLLVGVGLTVCSWVLTPAPLWLRTTMFIVAGFRIVDITQAAVNIGVFGHLGQAHGSEVNKLMRSLVLLVVNYVELVFWFGLLYIPLTLKNAVGVGDAFYFSAITQLTVGYGDITPSGVAKGIACLQAFTSWALSLLVLARFVAVLPVIRERQNTST